METMGNPTQIYDCIVIGGGISGVSFAHKLQRRGDKVLLLEKEPRLGGQVNTHVSARDSTFWAELGAHTCYNSYTRLLSIVKDLHLEQYVQPLEGHKYKMYAEGKIKAPMGAMSIPSLLLHGPRFFFTSRYGKTVKEYFGPIVGSKNYEKLFSKLFQAVISQNADDYPVELFLKGRKERFTEFPRKFTFKQGLFFLLDRMAKAGGFHHFTNDEVIKVHYSTPVYSVTTASGKWYSSKRIAFATSPQVASKLLEEIDPSVSELLGTIPVVKSATLNIVVPKDRLSVEKLAGIIPLTDEFLSATSRDMVNHPSLRSFSFHYDKQQHDMAQITQLACQVLGIRPKDIVEVANASHELPSLRLKHREMAHQVEKLRTLDSVFILGNYFYGLSLEDCVHRSFDEYERYSRL